jgi:aspartyl/asparaginyl-tRNA synthetase
MDIEKQMEQNNVEKVINVFETILNDFDGDYNFSDDITKIYQLIIKGIETKIIKGNSYNNEFKKLEDIIKKNKYNLDDYDEYIELLENLKSL